MNNDLMIRYAIIKLCEHINEERINLKKTVDLLEKILEKLDPNTENFSEKLKSITDAIASFKKIEAKNDKKALLNKMVAIQALFDLNSLAS
jgi:hypothetical protein